MKRNTPLFSVVIVVALALTFAVAGWVWRDSIGSGALASTPSNALTPAYAAAAKAPSAPADPATSAKAESKIIIQAPAELNVRPSGTSPSEGAASTDIAPPKREPLSVEQARIAELLSRKNFARAIAETANADDAQLNALSLLLVDFCMSHTAARAKTQAAVGGPPPSALRAKPAAASEGVRADATDPRRLDNARSITESCKDFNDGSGQSYADVAMTRLTAKGSNAALVFSELSPQLDYKALSPKQFSIITDALNEKNMALLSLLGSQIAPALEATFAGGTASETAAAALAWQLALCQVGAYCGRDSLAMREACWRFGACAGDDLSAAIRAAVSREGMTSTAFDKQVALFVKAINTHDAELLGIGRK